MLSLCYERCAGVTLCIKEHTVEASEARWIADPFIDQLRFGLAHEDIVMNSIFFFFFFSRFLWSLERAYLLIFSGQS